MWRAMGIGRERGGYHRRNNTQQRSVGLTLSLPRRKRKHLLQQAPALVDRSKTNFFKDCTDDVTVPTQCQTGNGHLRRTHIAEKCLQQKSKVTSRTRSTSWRGERLCNVVWTLAHYCVVLPNALSLSLFLSGFFHRLFVLVFIF